MPDSDKIFGHRFNTKKGRTFPLFPKKIFHHGIAKGRESTIVVPSKSYTIMVFGRMYFTQTQHVPKRITESLGQTQRETITV